MQPCINSIAHRGNFSAVIFLLALNIVPTHNTDTVQYLWLWSASEAVRQNFEFPWSLKNSNITRGNT